MHEPASGPRPVPNIHGEHERVKWRQIGPNAGCPDENDPRTWRAGVRLAEAVMHAGPAAGFPFPSPLDRLYTDPHQARTVSAGTTFDLVSLPMSVGLDAFDLLLRARLPIGPVAIDGRQRVRRVGFVLAPGAIAAEAALSRWIRQVGERIGARAASGDDVVTLPALLAVSQDSLSWLVPPNGAEQPYTNPTLLLDVLRRAVGETAYGAAVGTPAASRLEDSR
jgi:hypothetical protein